MDANEKYVARIQLMMETAKKLSDLARELDSFSTSGNSRLALGGDLVNQVSDFRNLAEAVYGSSLSIKVAVEKRLAASKQ
jgi:hypothetical protein